MTILLTIAFATTPGCQTSEEARALMAGLSTRANEPEIPGRKRPFVVVAEHLQPYADGPVDVSLS